MTTQLARPVGRTVTTAAVAVGVLAMAVLAYRWTAVSPVPYDDPQRAGSITLCSSSGAAVTGGDIGDAPFAAIVVGSTGVPADVDPSRAVGTLFAYQPREGVAASEFSGTAITAADVLADPARPTVVVPEDAWSIGDFVAAFPADLDGYVQLRLYLGTPAAGTLSDRPYDTADLRVRGDRWELVEGGTADCEAIQTKEK